MPVHECAYVHVHMHVCVHMCVFGYLNELFCCIDFCVCIATCFLLGITF